jgi:hypothetical protein
VEAPHPLPRDFHLFLRDVGEIVVPIIARLFAR